MQLISNVVQRVGSWQYLEPSETTESCKGGKPGGGEMVSRPGPRAAVPSGFSWGALAPLGLTFSAYKLEGSCHRTVHWGLIDQCKPLSRARKKIMGKNLDALCGCTVVLLMKGHRKGLGVSGEV